MCATEALCASGTLALGKLRAEALDNFRDLNGDCPKGRDYWKTLYSETSLPEMHGRYEAWLNLHILGGLDEFCAVYQHLARMALDDLRVINLTGGDKSERLDSNTNNLNH